MTTKIAPELIDTESLTVMRSVNRIINGDMRIDQRNGGSSITATSGSVFPVDRFRVGMTGANGTAQRVASGNAEFPFMVRATGTASTTAAWVGQYIESFNCTTLVGQQVTVSFYAASSNQTSLTVNLKRANAVDNFTNTTLVQAQTQAITSTLTRYSLTFNALPSAATNGLYLELVTGGNLATGTLDITGVQLVAGDVDLPFQHRQYGHEVALCQRYYFKANACPIGVTLNVSDGYSALVHFPAQMRANPTLDTGASFSVGTGSAGTPAISATNGEQARMNNSAANWTANTTVSVTAGFNAEIT